MKTKAAESYVRQKKQLVLQQMNEDSAEADNRMGIVVPSSPVLSFVSNIPRLDTERTDNTITSTELPTDNEAIILPSNQAQADMRMLPQHRQSLAILSAKLGEMAKREKKLRTSAEKLYGGSLVQRAPSNGGSSLAPSNSGSFLAPRNGGGSLTSRNDGDMGAQPPNDNLAP